MIPLRVKTCGESEFDIFEAKKTLSFLRESLCIEAKSQKIVFSRLFAPIHRLSLKQGSVFRFENVKFGFPVCFYSLEVLFLEKNFRKFFFTCLAPIV
jgi:hypothetical protein